MAPGPVFRGPPNADGTHDRRLAAIVTVLIVGFVGVAVTKPWGSAIPPAPSTAPSGVAVAPQASIPTIAPVIPGGDPPSAAILMPSVFETPGPAVGTAWTGLRWSRLAPNDPLDLVATVRHWAGGYIAIGWEGLPPKTPVWTSRDGRRWDLLPSATSSTFWPDQVVADVAGIPGGLVAITEAAQYCVEPCQLSFQQPAVAWTSATARTWSPHAMPRGWLPASSRRPPLVTGGPAGLVAASTGPRARIATSLDGSHWKLLPSGAFPARFALNDLRSASNGYVAVGHWMNGDGMGAAASLWSPDGRHWPGSPALLPTARSVGPVVGSVVGSLAIAEGGMVAIGRGLTSPGAVLWWSSRDGRHWSALPSFPPVGPTTCVGEACGRQPGGTLAADGRSIVALRGGRDAAAWVSTDGRSWRRLTVSGQLPDLDANAATLLPTGVLLTNGPTTWFGQAITR